MILLYGLAGIGALLVGLVAFLCLVGVYDRYIVLVSDKAKMAKEIEYFKKKLDWED
jgi:hypothetical protein